MRGAQQTNQSRAITSVPKRRFSDGFLDSDKSRGYRLQMICPDFLAGANLENENLEVLFAVRPTVFQVPPRRREEDVSAARDRKGFMTRLRPKRKRVRLDPELYDDLRQQVLCRDSWRCQSCGTMSGLEVHHKEFRSQFGDDSEQNLITLCTACHASVHYH
jgi:HNH endonuclease